MPTAPIDIQASEMRGAEQFGGASPRAANVLVDDTGALKSRPGIAAWSLFPEEIPHESPVIGMQPFSNFLVYVTEDRQIHAISQAGAYSALSTSGDVTTMLDGSGTPSLLALRSIIAIAGGGFPQKWDGSATTTSRLGGSPPRMDYLAGIATRVVGSVHGIAGTFQWSGLGDTALETWDALNYAEAEAKPDIIVNLVDTTNEVFVLGAQTLQVFSPDPVASFAPGRTLNIGLLAADSVVKLDDTLMFLDSLRRFVATDGREFRDISKDIIGEIQRTETVTDCMGMRLKIGTWDGIVWFFPTEGRGYIWSQAKGRWSEWRSWSQGQWTAPTITSSVQWPEQGLSLVGLETGQIAVLDDMATDDLGAPIENEVITGFQDHGTTEIKHCSCLRVACKGTGTLSVSWRDDLGAFSQPLRFDMSRISEKRSLGSYRKRQWKLRWTAAAGAAVVSMEEDFELAQRKAAA